MSDSLFLVTTDFSDEARRAYQPAADLARRLGGRVLLVHVVDVTMAIPHGAPLAPAQTPPDTAEHVTAAQNQIAEEAKLMPGVPVETEVRAGDDIVKTVLACADERSADWIVVSTNGHTGLRRFILGSTAEELVRHAERPVISIPPAPE